MENDIEQRLIRILKEKLGVDESADIRPEDSFYSLNINSLSFIKLIVEVEKEFGIEFEENSIDMDRLGTLKSLSEYILASGTAGT
ncbi:MAG TPA: acyl carrier protein [Ruminiclostridium sp.]|nr:acyl carrier protein [Ruminiclostridium sp.]